jgi:NifU-like protein involved in Fe-S cluster formation
MGHFHDRVKEIGKTVKEAENRACDQFMYENGQRYDIRDVKMIRKVRDVPPKKECKVLKGKYTYITMEEDPTAPKSEWLGEWEFEIHSHA